MPQIGEQTDVGSEKGLPSYEEATSLDLASVNHEQTTISTSLHSTAQPEITPTPKSDILPKPIAIPNTTTKWNSPFLRAYPPVLESFHISRELFLKFIDDLNRIAVQSPPLQALSAAGDVIGFVPEPISQTVGAITSVVTEVGMVAISIGRSEMYLRDCNRTIFEPRGLKCEIAKIEAVAKVAGIPILSSEGKVEEATNILGSLDEAGSVSTQQRRLQALSPYVAELDIVEVPNVHVPDNTMSKLNVKISEWTRKQGEKQMLKSRTRAVRRFAEGKAELDDDLQTELEELDEEETEIREEYKKRPERMEEKLQRVEKTRAKLLQRHGEGLKELEDAKRADDKEEKGMRKFYFILIRDKDADSGQKPNAVKNFLFGSPSAL